MNVSRFHHLRSRTVGLLPAIAVLIAVGFWVGEYMPNSHASGAGASVSSATLQPSLTSNQSLANQSSADTGQGFARIAKSVTPAVVNITATATRVSRGRDARDPMEGWFGMPGRPHGPAPPGEPHGGVGSGVIVSPDGYVLTNNHVVDGAQELTVTLPDKREFRGKVVGTDPKTDLAVIKIEGRDLPFISWGDSSKLQAGEYVLAVGNPFGLNSSVTLGIVSALGRGRMGITQYEDFIQTDAAINPGNSGGALVNTAGELVGINTAILSQTGGYQGVGFAVPASMAKPVYESLMATGRVVRGYLGVGIQDLTQELAASFDLQEPKGALVNNVAEDSPAERAGLKPGDVIVGYQGAPIEDGIALQRQVTRTRVGATVPFRVMRSGRALDLTVTIGEQAGPVKVAGADRTTEHVLAGLEVQSLDPRTAHELGLSGKIQGVLVTEVDPDSPVARAGIVQGDVIREINKQPVKSVQEFEKAVSNLRKDQQALMLINRRGASLFISVKV